MNNTLPSEQEVDQLLDEFFKSELPRQWPDFELPVARTLPFRPAAPRRRFVLGSRLALAASVALLTACGWLLSGSFDGPTKAETGPRGVKPEAKKPEMPPMPEGKQPDDLDHETSEFLSR
jgi:hypothetical protein